MTDTWIVLTIVAGVVLIVDLVATQLRKRARRIPVTSESKQKENETDVCEE